MLRGGHCNRHPGQGTLPTINRGGCARVAAPVMAIGRPLMPWVTWLQRYKAKAQGGGRGPRGGWGIALSAGFRHFSGLPNASVRKIGQRIKVRSQ